MILVLKASATMYITPGNRYGTESLLLLLEDIELLSYRAANFTKFAFGSITEVGSAIIIYPIFPLLISGYWVPSLFLLNNFIK